MLGSHQTTIKDTLHGAIATTLSFVEKQEGGKSTSYEESDVSEKDDAEVPISINIPVAPEKTPIVANKKTRGISMAISFSRQCRRRGDWSASRSLLSKMSKAKPILNKPPRSRSRGRRQTRGSSKSVSSERPTSSTMSVRSAARTNKTSISTPRKIHEIVHKDVTAVNSPEASDVDWLSGKEWICNYCTFIKAANLEGASDKTIKSGSALQLEGSKLKADLFHI